MNYSRVFRLWRHCYSAQLSKTPDGILKEELLAVLTVPVRRTRANTVPFPYGYPNKQRCRKSDTHTRGQDMPKNTLPCPLPLARFHFLKFPKEQQQLETQYTPSEPVGILHIQTETFSFRIPKAQGHFIMQNAFGLPPRVLKSQQFRHCSKVPV